MKKIVIIGAGEFQLPLIEKARSLNYETHVFAWEEGAIGKEIADYFYPISIVEKEEILKICKEIDPDGVTSIGSDLAVLTVNYVASNLGLTCNPEESVLITTNKYLMRNAFKENNIPIPNFIKVQNSLNIDELSDFSFPIIVKPTDRSGSRGITKIEKIEDIESAIEIAIENSFEKSAIIEEYIDGNEYSCECISYQGKHTCLSFTKKFTTGNPHFIETGHIEPSDLSQEQINNFTKEIFKALDALKIENGASHCEFKVTPNGKMMIVEIGARMGGDCIGSHLVELSTSQDYLKMVIEVSCGNPPTINTKEEIKYSYIKFIFNESDLECLNKIKQENPKEIVFISDIKDIHSHTIVDSSTRFGFFIGTTTDKEKLYSIFSNEER